MSYSKNPELWFCPELEELHIKSIERWMFAACAVESPSDLLRQVLIRLLAETIPDRDTSGVLESMDMNEARFVEDATRHIESCQNQPCRFIKSIMRIVNS